jgi:hypothetical protein
VDLIIEWGTPEQKQQIADGLSALFARFATLFEPPLQINRVVVSTNFDEWVNRLQGTTTYTSIKENGPLPFAAVGRVIHQHDDTTDLVFLPQVYGYDPQIRLSIYAHEFAHVANKRSFPKIPTKGTARSTYLSYLYQIFDEYWACRKEFEAVDTVFPTKGIDWYSHIVNNLTGIISLLDTPKQYKSLKKQIQTIRKSRDADQLVMNIQPIFTDVANFIIQLFAITHHYPQYSPNTVSIRSRFINEKTLALMEFFKVKYQQHETDLEEGTLLCKAFMRNFGLEFVDEPAGLSCRVFRI